MGKCDLPVIYIYFNIDTIYAKITTTAVRQVNDTSSLHCQNCHLTKNQTMSKSIEDMKKIVILTDLYVWSG